jgi:hypothetical protein
MMKSFPSLKKKMSWKDKKFCRGSSMSKMKCKKLLYVYRVKEKNFVRRLRRHANLKRRRV